MATVFLSYDHDDAALAGPIAAALEANGHQVWWDRHIHGGAEYNSEIETAVERADAVVVLWSANSVRSAWVRDEAGEGRDAGKLVPITIEAVKPPMGFRQFQTIDLTGWHGGKRIPRLPELLLALDRVSSAASAPATAPHADSRNHSSSRKRSASITLSRRALVGTGAAVAVAAGAGGAFWWSRSEREDPRVQALLDQASQQMIKQTAGPDTEKLLKQAVAIQSDDARAWALLGLLRSILAQSAEPSDAEQLVDGAEDAAKRALSLNQKEPDALLALFELQGSTLDWFTRDQRLREILAIDATNFGAISELVLLTQATGMCRESWELNERALALQPLSPEILGRRAFKAYILGRTWQADKISDQLRALYPTNPWAWFVRIHLYVVTDRPAAALALMESEPQMASRFPMTPLWKAALPALAKPSSGAIAKARDACVKLALSSVSLANEAVQILCALKELDTAFDLAYGYLLSRGPLVPHERPGSANAVLGAGWRISTQWMFQPIVSIMQHDRRFLPLCDGIGLTDYWRRRGVKPDYMRA